MKTNQAKGRGTSSKKSPEPSSRSAKAESNDMGNSALHKLFIGQLKDIYWAEKQLVKSLPKMQKAATSSELKDAIGGHLRETTEQVSRLERVFESMNEKASAKKCDAMAGLIEEANGLVEETEEGTMVRDVAIISAAQKVEHYEIASYGTLRTLAQVMGHSVAVHLLEQTLEEEKGADVKLTQVAEGCVNEQASYEEE